MANYNIALYSPRLKLLGMFRKNDYQQEFVSAEWARYIGNVGKLQLTFAEDAFDWDLITRDMIVVPYRSVIPGIFRPDMDGGFLVNQRSRSFSAGRRTISIGAACGNDLLRRRIVDATARSAYTSKTGPAGNIMKSIVEEHLGASAGARSMNPYFVAQAATGDGATLSKSFAWRKVLTVCQELMDASAQAGVYSAFDTVFNPGQMRFEFRTYQGQRGVDRRGGTALDLVLDPQQGTLEDAELVNDWSEELNFARIGGKGEGTARVTASVYDAALAGLTPFSRTETFVDARNAFTLEDLTAEGNAALRAARPQQVVTGQVQQTPGNIYGLDWNYGDYVRTNIKGTMMTTRLDGVGIKLSENGGETVQAAVRV